MSLKSRGRSDKVCRDEWILNKFTLLANDLSFDLPVLNTSWDLMSNDQISKILPNCSTLSHPNEGGPSKWLDLKQIYPFDHPFNNPSIQRSKLSHHPVQTRNDRGR
ncbi:hypothetical protein CEXT_561991 [Caerostris extrusa]|uniref:Ycf15 n=1 Tax=Caerostris extrusa TaxID=172846 RepID=A0AAV4NNC5_CAEEX|nr:hypothetical protein CEXT_561991 [Caerostris extrusa]